MRCYAARCGMRQLSAGMAQRRRGGVRRALSLRFISAAWRQAGGATLEWWLARIYLLRHHHYILLAGMAWRKPR